MKRGKQWIVAGVLLTTGTLVAGCPDETTAGDPVVPTPKMRDYLFPSSATLKLDYEETATLWSAAGGAPIVATSSFRIKAVSLTPSEAVYRYEVSDTPLGTVSATVVSADTVKLAAKVLVLGTLNMNFPDSVLTTEGGTVTPASGSVPAQVLARVAKESVTVPGGTFSTIKARLQFADGQDAPTYYWLAKGMGFYGVKQSKTSTFSVNAKVSTMSTEVLLTRVTP